ncbi:hypothetical protein LQ567_01460 [Niabella pedocola]|uniref:Uncharacterized protein n=1 Tax=Niabella pedocola TaxID=1752077 RepID=A0ABS8PK88_9BACT|nr:hypothetical protein [Niabella pedocola]MCD2421411.1 hypothetical protein [Niabella pedocola]
MKIRIKGNSLRYRLTRSEVAKLWKKGNLEEQTVFAGNTLIYAIENTKEAALSADFSGSKIVLSMPQTMIEALYNTDQVGFEDVSGNLHLLVEKDFVCIDNTAEDQSDNYPNPSLTCD